MVASWHMGSSQNRDRTRVPCIGRWILNHWTSREVAELFFLKKTILKELWSQKLQRFPWTPHLSYPTRYNLHNCSTVSNSETDNWSYTGVSTSVSFYNIGRFVKPPSNSECRTVLSPQRSPWCYPFKVSLTLLPSSIPDPRPLQICSPFL